MQFEARAKWNAWAELKGMSKEEAMRKYVELITAGAQVGGRMGRIPHIIVLWAAAAALQAAAADLLLALMLLPADDPDWESNPALKDYKEDEA